MLQPHEYCEDETCKFRAEEISDGYHTFDELYDHRLALNAAFFNLVWATQVNNLGSVASHLAPYPVMKSKLHNDGTMFDGYFIVFGIIPNEFSESQISYHYKLEHWDKFQIPEVPKIPFPYDGHTSKDVVERLLSI